jgi:hypothetical protein
MPNRYTQDQVAAKIGISARSLRRFLGRAANDGVIIPGVCRAKGGGYDSEKYYNDEFIAAFRAYYARWHASRAAMPTNQQARLRQFDRIMTDTPSAADEETTAPAGPRRSLAQIDATECSIDTGTDATVVTTKSRAITTVDEALAYAQIDLTIWELDRCVVNSWDMGYKDASGTATTVPLYQVKVWLKRKSARSTEAIFDGLMERVAAYAPRYAPNAYPLIVDPHLLEISLFDHHFGKLAWRRETGEDYDLRIAERVFEEAMHDLVAKASGFNVDEILLPIGNDFLHIDNKQNTTAAGTPQDQDGRFEKIVETGQLALVRAIDFLQQIAPVRVKLVKGNHDFITIWHTARFLAAWYRNCPNVEIDTEPIGRKYHRYGTNLIGFTHCSEEKQADLPLIMASEQPALWSDTQWHEWHVGHLHRKKETQFVSVDGRAGVVVRVLPSLTGTDAWHYAKGYISNKMAEAYLFSYDRGPTGYLVTSRTV